MKSFRSKIGFVLAGLYIVVSVGFILTQGLFGESFIVIILGLPWSLLSVLVGSEATNALLVYALFLTPLVVNTLLFYWIGSCAEQYISRKSPHVNDA